MSAKKWVTLGTTIDIPDPAVARARARDILISHRDGASDQQARGLLIEHSRANLRVLRNRVMASDFVPIGGYEARPFGTEVKQKLAEDKGLTYTFEEQLPLFLRYCATKRKNQINRLR